MISAEGTRHKTTRHDHSPFYRITWIKSRYREGPMNHRRDIFRSQCSHNRHCEVGRTCWISGMEVWCRQTERQDWWSRDDRLTRGGIWFSIDERIISSPTDSRSPELFAINRGGWHEGSLVYDLRPLATYVFHLPAIPLLRLSLPP